MSLANAQLKANARNSGNASDRKTRIVVLSVSAGAGHVRAAEAIRTTAIADYPHLEVVHLDVMDLVNSLFRKLYSESYAKVITKHPALWGYFYDKSDHGPSDNIVNRLHNAMERLNLGRLRKALEGIQPDLVICTHFLPAQLLSRLYENERYRVTTWVQVTDFDVHALWLTSHMEGYFAASDEVAWRMRDRGLEAARIHVTGIPIMPTFTKPLDKAVCAAELGLDPARPTLLLMAGGLGLISLDDLARRLLALDVDFQMIALAGKNAELLQRLETVAADSQGRLKPLGFTSTIERLMAASDLAVTKPGGLTTSECLAMGLPMIIVSPIPGQEERNADYLLEEGTALKAPDAAGLEFRVRRLLRDRPVLRRLADNARRVARPNAARTVLDLVTNTPR